MSSDVVVMKVMELCEQFGELKKESENNYGQVLEWAKQQLATQQQTIARLTSRLDELEKKQCPPT